MVIFMKKIIIISILVLACGIGLFFLVRTPQKEEKYEYTYNTYDESGNVIENKLTYSESKSKTNFVRIETSKGDIFVELYPDVAPITVKNFKKLVSQGFYKNMIFHRVIKDFMIQTGDPTGTGNGGSSEKIKGEFSANGIKNDLEHTRGVISMARAKDMNSASSQFFIVHKDYPSLDGNYAAFGRVIAGLETVDKIATVMTKNDKPVSDVRLSNITFIKIK